MQSANLDESLNTSKEDDESGFMADRRGVEREAGKGDAGGKRNPSDRDLRMQIELKNEAAGGERVVRRRSAEERTVVVKDEKELEERRERREKEKLREEERRTRKEEEERRRRTRRSDERELTDKKEIPPVNENADGGVLDRAEADTNNKQDQTGQVEKLSKTESSPMDKVIKKRAAARDSSSEKPDERESKR